MERARVTTRTECGDERSSEVTASSHAQLSERKARAEPTAGRWKGIQLSARHRCQAQWCVKTSVEQKQHLWRCS